MISKKSILVALILSGTLCMQSLFAANIVINGTVNDAVSITVNDTNAGIDLANLGGVAYDVKVGDILVNSNVPGGFKLTFKSLSSTVAQLQKSDGTDQADEVIDYDLELKNQSCTVCSSLTIPALTVIEPTTAGVDRSFVSDASKTVDDLGYDIHVQTGLKNLQPADGAPVVYTDTIEITITAL